MCSKARTRSRLVNDLFFILWLSSVIILNLSNIFKSKKKRHKFGCSCSTKYGFLLDVTLCYNDFGPTEKHCGCKWLDHMSKSTEVFLKLFLPSSSVSADFSFNCLALTFNISEESLSEPLWRCYSSYVFRDKTVKTFHSCSMESVVFKGYFCFFFILPYIWTISFSSSNLEVVRGSVLWSFAVQSAEQ